MENERLPVLNRFSTDEIRRLHSLTRFLPSAPWLRDRYPIPPTPDSVTMPTMLWPEQKRARYAAVRERMTSGEGKRMRCIRGARAAHASMWNQGRAPGAEGRAAIAANREARRRDMEQGKGWRHSQTDLSGI